MELVSKKSRPYIGRIFFGLGSRLTLQGHATVTVNATSYREAKDKITMILWAEFPGLMTYPSARMLDVDTYADYERTLNARKAA